MNKFNFIKDFLSEYIVQTDKSKESYQILKSFLRAQKDFYLVEVKEQFIYLSVILLGSVGIYIIIATILWYFLGGFFTLLLTGVLCILLATFGSLLRKKTAKLKEEKNNALIQAQNILEDHFKTLTSPADTLICIFRIIQETEKLFKKISQQFFT